MKRMTRTWWLAALLATACQPHEVDRIPVVEATIADIQEAILSGRTTCRDVVQAYLDRIETYDEATGLNAITVVNPNALSTADAIDRAIANHDGAIIDHARLQ